MEQPKDDLSVHKGSPDARGNSMTPWAWLATANFASGLPYVIVATLSTIVFKNMGVSNEANAFWSAMLLTPWTFKPLWSPLIDKYWTKRNWIIFSQFLTGCAMFLVAAAMQFPTSPPGEFFSGVTTLLGVQDLPQFFLIALIFLGVVAFLSATYDIACDGFYMLALRDSQQSFFVGVRSTFYRLSMIAAGGFLPIVAGAIQTYTSPQPGIVEITAAKGSAASPALVEFMAPPPDATGLFVQPAAITAAAGEPTTFHIRLAEKPAEGREVVVLSRVVKGPDGLSFNSGDRLTFTTANWDQPTTVTVTVKANAVKDEPTTWVLNSTAGNISLSWTVIFVGVALLLIGLSGYHATVMPVAQADARRTDVTTPLWKALLWVGAVIVLPGILWWVSSTLLLNSLRAQVQPGVMEHLTNSGWDMLSKLTPVAFQLGANSAVLLAVAALLLIGPIRGGVSGAYKFASDASGVGFYEIFGTFFAKHKIGIMLAFILLFRLGESQIVKMGPVFLLDERSKGGLALTPGEVGWIYQTVGVCCLLVGGILGGWLISTYGLRKVIWPLVGAMHIPNFFYVYMAVAQPTSLAVIGFCVGVEQLGYGIGFAAFMMYLIYAAQGEFKTSHYALCTGFMSLGMQIPMMFSGFLQTAMGYPSFFFLACMMVLPGVFVIPFLPMDAAFGKRAKS